MKILSVNGIRISGICACLPKNKVDIREACLEMYGEKGVETLIKATGITSKRIADKGTTALDLCTRAASALIDKCSAAPQEIGAVICVTFTPEYLMPADAPSAQARLGLSNECLAFDINMACSGYGYGLYVAALLAKQLNKKVLLLDGDVQSAYFSEKDKATMPVMADAGTATLLEPCDGADEWSFSFYTDGAQRNVLYIPSGGAKKKTTAEDIEEKEYKDGSRRRNTEIIMDGFGIFRFVAVTASKFIKSFMELTASDNENIDAFIPHQANIYMISELAKKLKISKEKMWKSGDVYGNPSSASIPLTIAANAAGRLGDKNARTLISGFGGGLSISAGIITLDGNACYSVIDYEEKENAGKIS